MDYSYGLRGANHARDIGIMKNLLDPKFRMAIYDEYWKLDPGADKSFQRKLQS